MDKWMNRVYTIIIPADLVTEEMEDEMVNKIFEVFGQNVVVSSQLEESE